MCYSEAEYFKHKTNQPRRGCRSGQTKQRLIKTISSVRKHFDDFTTRSVNYDNLIELSTKSNNIEVIVTNRTHDFKPTHEDINGTGLPIGSHVLRPSVNFSNLVSISRISAFDVTNNVSVVLWNARSICNKLPALASFLYENKPDICVITESWISSSSKGECVKNELCSLVSGYGIYSRPRASSVGGGVAVIARDNLNVKVNRNHQQISSFESMDLSVKLSPELIRLLIVYRPPPSKKNNQKLKTFFDDFSSLLEWAVTLPGWLVILGDFNFHIDNSSCPDAKKFLKILDSFGLVQHVIGPTHSKGHTLDLVITRSSQKFVMNFGIDNTLPSDHSLVNFICDVTRPRPKKIKRETRKISSIDADAINKAKMSTPLKPMSGASVDELVSDYNDRMGNLLNDLAPLTTKVLLDKSRAPWHNDVIHRHKVELRRLERKFRTNPLEINRQIFLDKRSAHNRLTADTRNSYHRNKIQNADQKQLFQIIDDIIGEKKSLAATLPNHTDPQALAQSFSDFFTQKVQMLRNSLDSIPSQYVFNDCDIGHSFTHFTHVTESCLLRLVSKMNSKSCSLDPFPTSHLKLCIQHFIPRLTQIINTSFNNGQFPCEFKHAIVRPLLKKPGLDSNVLKNYRPVSNCPFGGKLIEKCVAEDLDNYLTEFSLYSKFQSAYRKYHSTESALLKVHNDIMLALDGHSEVILVLLDLSAAFDTIDHCILLKRLQKRFGIKGLAL
ncbi:hypothetical protein SNE40_015382 [Patella caerulea]|uniref:Reverse transcriptase domain-containing protein n=1 Tax=Patella caerulea TaxID=87958 RepID=A0AAN8JJX3_PATCE